MYSAFIKRFLDFCISLVAVAVLSPVLLLLTVAGAVAMGGNPFFVQKRPGRIRKSTGEEKIFRLIKFRTMNNRRDKNGELLPDAERLNRYGRILRSTSLDELPELINILKGDMSIVGPRPLLVKYLPLYSKEQRRRHRVRPGLTGLAQINGRNAISWQQRFALDVRYVDSVSFATDIKIIVGTFSAVLKSKGISSATNVTMEEFRGNETEEEKVCL